MSANATPRYPATPNIGFCTLSAANTATDGTGTTGTAFTANASVQSRIDSGVLKCAGSTVATVARFFYNNGSTPATASNNTYVGEVQIAAFTASNTTEGPDIPIPAIMVGDVLPAGWKVLVTLGTATGGGNISFTIKGADYA